MHATSEIYRFLLLIYVNGQLNILEENIFNNYNNFELMYHYENATFDLFCKYLLKDRINVIYNHDTVSIFRRPRGYKYLHVILLKNPETFEEYSKIYYKVIYDDRLLFIVEDVQSIDWNKLGFENAGSLIVYHYTENVLYYVMFYDGDKGGSLQKVAITSDINLDKYVNKFYDFNGYNFRIGYIDFEPFFTCMNETESSECTQNGIEANSLELLSKKRNFTYTLKKYGDNGWNTMIHDIALEKLDWCLGGMRSTLNRRNLVKFSFGYRLSTYLVMVSSNVEGLNYKTLQLGTWIVFFVTLPVIGVLMHAFNFKYRQNPLYTPRFYIKYFVIPYKVLLEQPCTNIKGSLSFNIIFSVWLFMSMVINTSFRSKLSSHLTVGVNRVLRNVDELVNDGYIFRRNNIEWATLKENLQLSYDNNYGKILANLKADVNFCDIPESIDATKSAFIDEDVSVTYRLRSVCTNITRKSLKLQILPERLFPISLAVPFKRNAPYEIMFSNAFNNLVATGLISKWEDWETYQNNVLRPVVKNDLNTQLGGFFMANIGLLILLVGSIIATVIFCIEKIHFARNK